MKNNNSKSFNCHRIETENIICLYKMIMNANSNNKDNSIFITLSSINSDFFSLLFLYIFLQYLLKITVYI